jgi:hypothetical protein
MLALTDADAEAYAGVGAAYGMPRQTDEEKWVRQAALGNLTDQAALTQIAQGDSHPPVREAAAGRLTDEAVLAQIAQNDTDWQVRLAAARRLTNQPLLAQIAQSDSDPSVRKAAVGGLTDQAALAHIAESDAEVGVRAAAVGKLTDQRLLTQIARTDLGWSVRRAAVQTLTDRIALAQIAQDDPDQSVRHAAGQALRAVYPQTVATLRICDKGVRIVGLDKALFSSIYQFPYDGYSLLPGFHVVTVEYAAELQGSKVLEVAEGIEPLKQLGAKERDVWKRFCAERPDLCNEVLKADVHSVGSVTLPLLLEAGRVYCIGAELKGNTWRPVVTSKE